MTSSEIRGILRQGEKDMTSTHLSELMLKFLELQNHQVALKLTLLYQPYSRSKDSVKEYEEIQKRLDQVYEEINITFRKLVNESI